MLTTAAAATIAQRALLGYADVMASLLLLEMLRRRAGRHPITVADPPPVRVRTLLRPSILELAVIAAPRLPSRI